MTGIQHFFAALTLVLSLLSSANTLGNEYVQIRVRSSVASVSKSVVTIGDIADIKGGSRGMQEQVSAIDIDLIESRDRSVSISRKQIEFRLMLAGFATSDFEVTGSELVSVRLAQSKDLQQQVEQLVIRELASQFGLVESDIRVQLIDREKLTSVQNRIDTSDFTAMAVFDIKLPLGENSIQIDFRDSHGNRASAILPMRIIVFQEVAVARSRIPRGTVITADYIQTIKRPLADNSVVPADAKLCLGCVASKDIHRHEIVVTNYLATEAESNQPLLRRNDFVNVVVEKGPVTIKMLNVKVLSPGSKGEFVQVLNTVTNLQFTAMVRDKATVVVK